MSIHAGSPNSLNTNRQTHTSHVQRSLEVISCVSGVEYLHQDGWKIPESQEPRDTLLETKEEITVETLETKGD